MSFLVPKFWKNKKLIPLLLPGITKDLLNLMRKSSLKKNGPKINNSLKNKMLAVSTIQGFEIINVDSIYYLNSQGPCTIFYLADSKKKVVTQNLGHYEKRLPQHQFLRIHHSYMVNITKVLQYRRYESNIILTNGTSLPVSRSRKAPTLRLLNNLR